MNAKAIVKIIFAVLMALFCLALAGAYFYFSNLAPEGKLVFMAPGEASVIVIDGGERIELSERQVRTVELESGTHTIEVLAPVELEPFEVEVPEFGTLVVPIADPQCFALMDVAQSAYDIGKHSSPIFVSATKRDGPFKLESFHYTSMTAVPNERTSGERVYLLGTNTCEVVGALAAEHAGTP